MSTYEGLLDAVRANDVARVRELLDAEPELIHGRDEAGMGPILTAAFAGASEVLALLLERVGDALDAWEAAALGKPERLEAIARKGAETLGHVGPGGWTPLHLAAFVGHEGAVRVLLAAGVAPDASSVNAERNTPLHAAIAGAGNHTVAARLLDAGVPVNATAARGVTSLHLAAARGNTRMIELLLSRGAEARAMDDGTTPRDLAEQRGHPEAVERLGG
ncbi:MAG: ankyrin repeat domain-containing protein [Gemmatimonadales bacterium]|jgi:ankyrin repeat protein